MESSDAADTPAAPQRPGFLAGQLAAPDDFDQLGEPEIAASFEGDA